MVGGDRQKNKLLVVILGPTAVGKTSMSIDLAHYFDTEILSADSRQFYREMHIGTAKPSQEEMKNIPHHLIDSLSIQQNYDVRKFEKDAEKILSEIFTRKDQVIVTGGSGLFIQALCHGLDDMPGGNAAIRQRLEARMKNEGREVLAGELEKVDPEYAKNADLRNPRRIIRGLEVYYLTGKPFSSFRSKSTQKEEHPQWGKFNVLKFGLFREREELYHRIDRRVDKMIAEGLLDEVKQLWPYRDYQALQTVGYKELIGYLNKQYSWEEAVRLVKRNSRRLAKRQMTWFRRDPEIHWFKLEQESAGNENDKVKDDIFKSVIELIGY